MGQIAQRFGLEWLRENLRADGVLLSGITVHPRTREHYEVEAGIAPSISILFTLAKNESRANGRELMIRICADWLSREDGDAALVQNEEGLLLLRRSGLLTVSSETDWWTPEFLRLLPSGWQRGPLPAM